jgi:putative ABC transport system substrate-binding protein
MNRRRFIALLGGAAAAWPVAARAQQPTMPVIGFISSSSPGSVRPQVAGFREGLKEAGYVEGQSVAIEYRFAEGQSDRFPAFISDLIRRQVSVLAVTGSAAARAAMQVTVTIPIVFSSGEDPVAAGLVDSLNQPSRNLTGIYMFAVGLEPKRLGLLHEMVPKAKVIAVLVNSNFSGAETQLKDLQEAAPRLGVRLVVVRANAESDFNSAFSILVQEKAEALLVCASPFFNTRREQLVVLAARHAMPAIYEWRDFAAAGGLMSYGTSLTDAYRQVGVYVGRVLKGAKPADLPVMQSTKFEFVINLSTAKALGIEVPPTLSARADEVIE